jgi:hypothetical protein
MNRIQKIIQEILQEKKVKRDRCLRIADRKFDKPSAYKSGAVVRCRKGDIWKGIKEGQYDDTSKFDLVKQNPFNIQKLVDKGIIFVSKPGDGKGGVGEPSWEGDASIITLKNLENADPWMKISIKTPMPQAIPHAQKTQDKLIYNGKYNQILWGIEKKGLKPEDFYLSLKETDDPQSGKAAPYGSGYAKLKDIIKEIIQEEEEIKNLKVYHSTDSKFKDFSLDHAWDGFWFTNNINVLKNKEAGAAGNKYIMTRYITLTNPAGWDEYDKYSIGELIDEGYDGVILPEDNRIDYLVFDPKSISKNIKETNDPQSGKAAPYGSGYAKLKDIIKEIIQEDESLRKWFKRSGTPGKEGGWVDCNSPIRKDGKITGYKSCGRKKGEKRSKYPSCRPTAAKCKDKGKGKTWGKTK